MKTFFDRLKTGLVRTHNSLMNKIDAVFSSGAARQEILEMLEEALITADIGMNVSSKMLEGLKEKSWTKDINELKGYLKDEIFNILKGCQSSLELNKKPFVIMAVGVNGVGKTTTIGKLAAKFKADGKDCLLAAGDTFRAAAIEQLEIWTKRADCDLIKQSHGGDPAAVAFDAVKAAISRDVDILIIDTAGRLHTKTNLMDELKKIKRIINREISDAPHEILLVLDASTGQNALNQARMFNEAVGVTGIALTKLDGTAKGGIVVAIADELKIPIRWIGVGEAVEDLHEFDAKEFAEALI